jgi:hypothetical protein
VFDQRFWLTAPALIPFTAAGETPVIVRLAVARSPDPFTIENTLPERLTVLTAVPL